MTDSKTARPQHHTKRKGAVPRPVQPVGAAIHTVTPFDPLHAGRATFHYRRPLTSELLEHEFRLTRKQAYAVATHTARHGLVRRSARAAALKYWGVTILLALSFAIILYYFLSEPYLDWSASLPTGHPALVIVPLLIATLLAFTGFALWLLAERRLMDRIVDREIRRCWHDQECLWCGHDMTGCTVDRERWSRCPECGMRSPIGARATTI